MRQPGLPPAIDADISLPGGHTGQARGGLVNVVHGMDMELPGLGGHHIAAQHQGLDVGGTATEPAGISLANQVEGRRLKAAEVAATTRPTTTSARINALCFIAHPFTAYPRRVGDARRFAVAWRLVTSTQLK